MKLLKVQIENFKGIPRLYQEYNGNSWTVSGANGSGKTSIYDAYLWLLFDKDSDDKTKFSARPLDANNDIVKELTIAVEIVILHDGKEIKLCRKNIQDGKGYCNKYWINDVPKKAGEYSDYINSLVDESVFRLLSDLQRFNTLDWQKRRSILLELAGDIVKPKGYETLLDDLQGRSIEEYKKVVQDQRKLQKKSLDEINPRIDELDNTINSQTHTDGLLSIEEEREQLQGEIATLDAECREIEIEQQEQRKVKEQKAKLEQERAALESRILSDKSYVAGYTERQGELKQSITLMQTNLTVKEQSGKQQSIIVQTINSKLGAKQKELQETRGKFKELKGKSLDTNCYACGQILSQKALVENEKKKKEELTKIAETGKELTAEVEELQAEHKEASDDLTVKRKEYEDYRDAIVSVKEEAEQEIKQLQGQIDNADKPDYKQDIQWQALEKKIKQIVIPEVDTNRLTNIAEERQAYLGKLDQAHKALAQRDNVEAAKKRIAELEGQEKVLAQDITRLDGVLAQIAEYKKAESDMIVDAVNCQFKHTKFKLFDIQLNGEYKPCCTALLDGVPYPDMSTGQKIKVGIDIVNRLSSHYQLQVPLFIDNAESYTMPLEAETQVIKLVAKKSAKKLLLNEGV